MTYLKRSNTSQKKNLATTGAIILGLGLIFFIGHIFPSFYEKLFSPFTSFAWKSEMSIGSWFHGMAELARGKAALIAENDALRQEVSLRDSAALLLESTRSENEELKTLLGRKDSNKDILGVVLSRPPASPYDTFVIDIGSNDGVKVGSKVYTGGSILIGDIAEVFGKTSKVSLFSTPGRTISLLLGITHKEIQATGNGGGNFTARVPVGISVEKGDSLAFPQLRDHVFGVVQSTKADSTDSLQTILFKAPITINEVKFVQVEK